jgi:hypothetical protein
LAGRASSQPTIGLVDAARTHTATVKTTTQQTHSHPTLHTAAVDHLLETGLLRTEAPRETLI